MESDEYEVTDSEDEYSKDDKVLLEYARKSMKKRDVSSDVNFCNSMASEMLRFLESLM